MPASPVRRGILIAAALAVGAAALAVLYFRQVFLVDERRIRFPPERDNAPTRRFEADALLGRPGTGGFVSPAGRTPEDVFPRLRELLTEHPTARLSWKADARLPVARVTLGEGDGRVRRRALAAPAGAHADFPVLVPADGWLEFHYGALSFGSPIHFSIEVVDERGASTPVFHEKFVPRRHRAAHRLARFWPGPGSRSLARRTSRDESWRGARVDLAPWGRRAVRLRFRTEVPPDGGEDTAVIGFWGEPRVWGSKPLVAEPRRVGRAAAAGANLLFVVLESARGDGISLEGFSEQTPPRLRGLFLEGVGVRRFYTNAVESAGAWEALLSSRRPRPSTAAVVGTASWVRRLAEAGYRTSAVGAFTDADLAGSLGEDFDEIATVPNDGYAPLSASVQALSRLDDARGRGPHALFVYLRGVPRHRWPPVRFWALSLKRLPWSHRRWARWREAAVQAYVDDALGRLLEAAAPERSANTLVGVVSLAGSPAGDRPVIWRRGERRRWSYWSEPGLGLRESEVRGVWCFRHPALPSGRLLARPAQLIDVGPTVLGLLELGVAAGAEGRVLDFRRETPVDDTSVHITVRGREAKALLIDGHYKYIRHRPVSPRRWRPRRFWIDYPREEVFDLWTDPGEKQNLASRRRTLLARLRQAMDETDPEPTDIRLSFLGMGGARAQGSATCSFNGLRVFPATDFPWEARGRYEFSFTLQDASGTVVFGTDPPGASYMMYLTVNGRYMPPSRIRVSRLALPLFESAGDGWHDRIKFPWMDGWAELPSTATVPTAYLGRRERDPAVWRPAQDRLASAPVWSPFPSGWLLNGVRAPSPSVAPVSAPSAATPPAAAAPLTPSAPVSPSAPVVVPTPAPAGVPGGAASSPRRPSSSAVVSTGSVSATDPARAPASVEPPFAPPTSSTAPVVP